jgi:GH15 family glucan-1,4-alpha-glucosidase
VGDDPVGCPERYPPIDAYAFLSDGHTAALTGPDGAVEWLCAPRFDGPSVFARLLDARVGGAFELSVAGSGPPRRRYLDGTLVLESLFETASARVVLLDFLSLEAEGRHGPGEVDPHHVLVRLVRCERGQACVRALIDARPDYGRRAGSWFQEDGFFFCEVPGSQLAVSSDRPLTMREAGPAAEFGLSEGEAAALTLRYAGRPTRPITAARAFELLDVTVQSWRAWSGRCRFDGIGRELVVRSALVLKGLVYHPTGALLAAPTTSLPEDIGGERNWDYRFSWLRDAAFMLTALMQLGYGHEAQDYIDFLLAECVHCGDEPHLMLGIGGEHDLGESTLDHLEGYACSAPVRVGNAAHEQFQLGTYGTVLGAALAYQRLAGALSLEHWRLLRSMVELTCRRWRDPDSGIWEVRSEPRHFTHSKVMAWVCVAAGIELAQLCADSDAPLARWCQTRDHIRADVLERGYDADLGAFVQSYGSRALDASLLRLPLVGFLDGKDPRMTSTIERIIEQLESDEGFVSRYLQAESDDGLRGGEGAFAICSFWLVSALVRAGRVPDARRRFETLCARASELGLYAEELAPDGMLGNFPQAFTHLALIQAAVELDGGLRAEAEGGSVQGVVGDVPARD